MQPFGVSSVLYPFVDCSRVLSGVWRPCCVRQVEVLSALLCYVREFLAKPHADVGRGGPVCPFIPKARLPRHHEGRAGLFTPSGVWGELRVF